MTGKRKATEIKKRIIAGGFTVGKVIVESRYTGLRQFLQTGKIELGNLDKVEEALGRLEAEKADK